MGVHEIFPAVQAAETAVQHNPHFVEAWQTLGRAQLGLGEITMLLQQKRDTEVAERKRGVVDITPEVIPDYDLESDEVVAACDAISQRQKMAAAAADKTIVVSASVNPADRNEEKVETNYSKEFIKAR
ncbi:hypothetical protein XELAEV_18011001mg [Xenopus laevis]|uniref:Tetratricopeptide repeat protein 33 n=1 Tax=Xenopus laevis TaxID=8355 RepID=A0A974DVU6_XENLA|nr:hypothetical protein XELAEV_18011001mg [Xenopus laevis]